jgi:DMSO/TMAO reductase YedYZ molybdopterin-dependent catalytic subunit
MTMSQASLDRVLAVLLVAVAATGWLTLRAGIPQVGWVFTVHGIAAGVLSVAVVAKLHRSVPKAAAARRFGRLALGLIVGLATTVALIGGFLWVGSGELLSLGSWTVLTVHAWVGVVLVPLLVVHLMPRRWRLLRPGPSALSGAGRWLSRRSLLAAGGLAVAGLGLFGALNLLDRLRGGERRFTGSRWLPTGGIPPPTTFYGEPTPTVDTQQWRIVVTGAVARERAWTLAELGAIGTTELTGVLDCTSGWAIETAWHGVPLATLLDAAGVNDRARTVEVRSVTGWGTSLPLEEARRALLATGVASADLQRPNGSPCRLVVPDRRGIDWVKWVGEIRVS